MPSILSNTSALISQASLNKANEEVQASITRLSTGSRFDKASTDVASTAIATSISYEGNENLQRTKNLQQGLLMLGVANGAVNQVISILNQQANLASQSASASLSARDRGFLQLQFGNLTNAVDQIAKTTNFNGIKLVDGSLYNPSGAITTATTIENSQATTTIKLGSGGDRVVADFSSTLTLADVDSYATATDNLEFTIANHGLDVGMKIVLDGTNLAALTTLTAAQCTGVFEITSKTATTFKISLPATPAAAAGVGATVVAASAREGVAGCSDLISGDTLNINGCKFNAVSTSTGAANDIIVALGQTPDVLASKIKSAIDNVISTKAPSYEKLLGVNITVNNGEITFKHQSNGVVGDTFFITTGATTAGTLQGGRFSGGAGAVNAPSTITLEGGKAGALTMMNGSVYGSMQDTIIRPIAGGKATASFKLAVNPSATADGTAATAASIANTSIFVNGSSNSVRVNAAGHGLVGGETVNLGFTGGAAATFGLGGATDQLTLAPGAYNIRYLDADNFEIYSPTNITGNYIGDGSHTAAGVTSFDFDFTSVASYKGDRINVNGVEFKYVAALTGLDKNEILIGADIAATTKNTISALNNSQDPRVLQATYAGDSTTGVITATYKANGTNAAHNFTLGGSLRSDNITITNSTLTGGTATAGVDISKITNNTAFVGKLEGFKADFSGGISNEVNLSIDVGGYTYKADKINTAVGTATWVTLTSTTPGGGSFSIELAANEGVVVNNQNDADIFAARLDSAFSNLKITQRRELESFEAVGNIYNGNSQVGSLTDAAIFLTTTDFNKLEVSDVKFSAPPDGQTNAKISFTINGAEYAATTTGSVLGKGSLVKLTNQTDSNQFVELLIGDYDMTLTTAADALAVTEMYKNALKTESLDNAGLSFQAGAGETIPVQIQSVQTTDLYLDPTSGKYTPLSITDTAKAQEASAVLAKALESVTSINATIGALQSRFQATANVAEVAVQNLEQARSSFADTDISSESTKLALATVKLNSSISMLVQANELPENLLQLIR